MKPDTDAPRVFQYVEVANQIRRQIEKSILRPGDQLPSRREMHRDYGVNITTMEKAHALLEKEGLIVRSNRRGVFVAERVQKAATGLIGLCGVSFSQDNFSPYWTQLIRGIEEGAEQAGARVVLLRGDSAVGWDKIDGLLVNAGGADVQADYLTPGLPLVEFFHETHFAGDGRGAAKATANTTTVLVDDYSGLHQLTAHLAGLGHRRIAYLHNGPPDPKTHRRLGGYRDALKEAGITPDERWIRALPSPAPLLYFMNAGREAMKQWLLEDWRELGCTALLAHNDDAAWGAVEALRAAGLDVPGEVSVGGYDDTQSAECCTPPLTTMNVPLRLMGRTGVELLFHKIGGGETPRQVVMTPELRVRASTAQLRGGQGLCARESAETTL